MKSGERCHQREILKGTKQEMSFRSDLRQQACSFRACFWENWAHLLWPQEVLPHLHFQRVRCPVCEKARA